MSKELNELHTLLVTSYVQMMKSGLVEDPRVLKEIRELLKDNDITGDIGAVVDKLNEAIEMPDEFLELVNNG